MKRKATRLIVVHVSATRADMDIGVREIRAMHRARGWSDIGYHRVIRRDGTVEPGRAINVVGAHVAGYNSTSVGVCLVGGVNALGQPQHNATKAQMDTLKTELAALALRYPDALICGHRDLSPDRDGDGVIEPAEHIKACPCFDAIPWAAALGLPAAPIKGVWTAAARPALPPVLAADADEARTAWLQRLLTRAGYPLGPVDGIIGRKTIAAIKAFQTQAALPVTGAFDAATVARLRALAEPERPAEAATAQPVADGGAIPASPVLPPPPTSSSLKRTACSAPTAAIAAIFTRLFGGNQGENSK